MGRDDSDDNDDNDAVPHQTFELSVRGLLLASSAIFSVVVAAHVLRATGLGPAV